MTLKCRLFASYSLLILMTDKSQLLKILNVGGKYWLIWRYNEPIPYLLCVKVASKANGTSWRKYWNNCKILMRHFQSTNFFQSQRLPTFICFQCMRIPRGSQSVDLFASLFTSAIERIHLEHRHSMLSTMCASGRHAITTKRSMGLSQLSPYNTERHWEKSLFQ